MAVTGKQIQMYHPLVPATVTMKVTMGIVSRTCLVACRSMLSRKKRPKVGSLNTPCPPQFCRETMVMSCCLANPNLCAQQLFSSMMHDSRSSTSSTMMIKLVPFPRMRKKSLVKTTLVSLISAISNSHLLRCIWSCL